MAYTASRDVAVGDPTEEADHDELAANDDYLQGLADNDHDFNVSTGTGDHKLAVGAPMHINVDNSTTVWSLGFWQSSDTRWWLLLNTADVASFTRADAEAYIPLGDITDVPTS